MRLIYVDDEKNAIYNFKAHLERQTSITSIESFFNASSAIAYAEQNPFDVAFLDIKLPDMTGFALAAALKALQPDIEVVYVTGYNEYHQEAYSTGGRGYLLKPFAKEEIDDIFAFLNKLNFAGAPTHKAETPKVFVQTFGYFDLWLNGEPVVFKNAKSKELLAVLVNQRGSVITSVEIFNYLWPDKDYSKITATYVRKVVQALKKQLEDIGCSELVTFSRNAFYANTGAFVCDYYTVTAGDTHYLANYNGYYMAQYPWAEESIYIVEQSIKTLAPLYQTPTAPPPLSLETTIL